MPGVTQDELVTAGAEPKRWSELSLSAEARAAKGSRRRARAGEAIPARGE